MSVVGLTPLVTEPAAAGEFAVRVIVRGVVGGGEGVEETVERLGGTVVTELDLIDGVAATVPSGALDALRTSPVVQSVTPDGEVEFAGKKGHGTHMAGIIAGRDSSVPAGREADYPAAFVGVAPGAHIVNVKVGASDGSVDVSQVIAAIDWVVEHRNDPGMNIRVCSTCRSGPTASRTPGWTRCPTPRRWPGARASSWVVSGGNDGRAHPRLSDPAMNPFVVAVGAADPHGTPKADDDTVPDFSSRGAPARRVDLTAPGQSIVSLRDPGSIADVEHPTARVGERFFRGSGTSQAAAVVSGAAALLLQQRPTLTPDQVKRLLVSTTMPMPRADAEGRGAGLLDVRRASDAGAPRSTQTWSPGNGTGTLEAARAGSNVDDQGVLLTGETDIFGRPWNSRTWAGAAATETAWNAGAWLGTPYTGDSWGGTSFASTTWQARSWREADWAARSWRSDGWSARSWRSGSWSGSDWLSSGWSARSWRDASM